MIKIVLDTNVVVSALLKGMQNAFSKNPFLGIFLLLMAPSLCLGQGTVSDIKPDVKEFRLENGMLFLIVERPTMPQVACRLAIRA